MAVMSHIFSESILGLLYLSIAVLFKNNWIILFSLEAILYFISAYLYYLSHKK
jgi:hypothetical protein